MQKTAIYQSEIGLLGIVYTETHIKKVLFEAFLYDKKSEKSKLSDLAMMQINQYLTKERRHFDLPLAPEGTDFQKLVWKELQKIEYGQIKSYKDISLAIKKEKAYRAVGMANNKNPIPIIIPCHRVIGSDGNLVGYAGGLELKKRLLELER